MTSTARASTLRIDTAHVAMMLAALALAYILPFWLVLASYAVLGPLHYLTEISWLHERHYFLPKRALAWAGVGLIILINMVKGMSELTSISIWLVFGVFATMALAKTPRQYIIMGSAFAVSAFAITKLPTLSFIVAALFPTIIHVSLFTFIFMLSGALRVRSSMQLLLAALYIVCAAMPFLFPPSMANVAASDIALVRQFFSHIGDALARMGGKGLWPVDVRLAGFLSFIYTYHYLNWFIKVNVIKWHDVPRSRLKLIGALWVIAVTLYYIDYELGFFVLLWLSLGHVILEFPLNAISIHALGKQLFVRAPVSTGR